jgi:hypothetical protein
MMIQPNVDARVESITSLAMDYTREFGAQMALRCLMIQIRVQRFLASARCYSLALTGHNQTASMQIFFPDFFNTWLLGV